MSVIPIFGKQSLKPDQIWQHKLLDIRIKIAIVKDEFIEAECLADNRPPDQIPSEWKMMVGEVYEFGAKRFRDNFKLSVSGVGYRSQHGVNCEKCQKHYPHAIKAKGFLCWECRSGF